MEKVQDFISKVPTILVDIINKQTLVKECESYMTKVERDIEYFKQYGTFKVPNRSSSNESNNVNTKQPLCESRTRQTVLNENHSSNTVPIKLERISTLTSNYTAAGAGNRESVKENIKIEKSDMPPPQFPVKKNLKIKKENNTRSTRSKASKKTYTSSDSGQGRESDVVLQKQIIELVILSDSDDESGKSNKEVSKETKDDSDENKIDPEQTRRVTRSKTRKKNDENNRRSRNPSADVEKKTKLAEMKGKKSEESPSKEISIYEDAEDNKVNKNVTQKKLDETYITDKNVSEDNKVVNNLDQTHVIEKDISKEVAISDQTVVVSTPKVVQNIPVARINIRDIMTDDEDDNTTTALLQKTKKTIKKGTKPIFSQFESSPVKKRVEAFEKLGADTASEIPVYMTKTRSKFNSVKEANKEPGTPLRQPIKDKLKNATPQMANRYLAATSYSACMGTRTKLINESYMSSKSASALKASQQEFKERENQRREKEAEAIRKRDELIQAQIQEKKKKRLEKQAKAQQMREALEKQEKIKKQQEVLKKAMEEKRKEERKAAEEEQAKLRELELKKAAVYKKKTKQLPLYLRSKAPLLPTEDCYDSDDEASQKQVRKPAWASKDRMTAQLRVMKFMDKDTLGNMFVLDITPDLRDIFEYIDPRKLKRTSSAVWRVPPRFTLMPESIEEGEEE